MHRALGSLVFYYSIRVAQHSEKRSVKTACLVHSIQCLTHFRARSKKELATTSYTEDYLNHLRSDNSAERSMIYLTQ